MATSTTRQRDFRRTSPVTVGRPAAELERQTVPGCACIVVDCREITFIDSVGIRTLIEATLNATKLGASFRLRGIPAPMTRVLDLAWLTDLFTIDDDRTPASNDGRPA